MYGISKTESDQDNLEKLPFFNKNTAGLLLQKEGRNLDRKLERLIKSGYFLRLKNGLYTTKSYLLTVGSQERYAEFLVPVLCYPAYLSKEYVLSKEGLIPEGIGVFTAITIKSTREFKNFLGRFLYQNIGKRLFCGFTNGKASEARALFDYLYLKTNLGADLEKELGEGLRINWDLLTMADLREFRKYVRIANSSKMTKIFKIMERLKK